MDQLYSIHFQGVAEQGHSQIQEWLGFISIFVDFESESKDFALDFRELTELEYPGFKR